MASPVSKSSEWQPPSHNPWLIALAVMSATFMEILDTSVANVSLPHIAGNLSVTTNEATWVLTSYLVSNAIVLPITGWLSIRFGRKRLLIFCIGLFTLASVLCGLASSLPFLILARILQGVGGGAMMPISQAILLESFPPAKRGQAMAVFAMGVVVAPILGPTLGGWITDNYSWRWIFYINLPIGLISILLARAFIEDPSYIRSATVQKMDSIGFFFLIIWLGTLQIILDKGQQEDWFSSAWIRWFALASIISFIAFIYRELTAEHPIVDLRVLKNRNFGTGVVLITMVGVVLYGTTAALPIFLQTLLGYPALQSGEVMSPRGVGAFLATLLVGRLVGKVSYRWLMVFGFVLLTIASFLLGRLNMQMRQFDIIWPSIVNGIAVSLIFVPLTTTTMAQLRQEQIGNASGIYNLMRNIGGSFGIAVVTTIIDRASQTHQADMMSHLTPYDPVYQERVGAISHALASQTGTWEASHQAQAIVYGIVQQQAQLAAFVDNFRFFGVICMLCVPVIFIFKNVKGAKPKAEVH
ncbi:MAG: Drug resistance transporter EmrB/QacA subfamily [Verrucomicrobiales bacterium]|nr:Drug resistance transporter EmrB/QacA subfamily [Verrucomicrobiales bacterium]